MKNNDIIIMWKPLFWCEIWRSDEDKVMTSNDIEKLMTSREWHYDDDDMILEMKMISNDNIDTIIINEVMKVM